MSALRRGFTGLIILVAIAGAGLALGACQAPGSILRGHVTTAAGTHPAGVPVAVYSNATEALVAETTTDLDGDYAFLAADLPDGTYRVLFASSDWWEGASTWGDATSVTATAAAPATIDATVDIATGSVSGSVTTGSDPLPGATVEAIESSTDTTTATTASAAGGTFSFAGLPTGDYVFRFSKSGYTTRYNNAADTKATAPVVTVTDGADITGISTPLAVQSTITGTLTDGVNPAGALAVIAYDPGTGEALGFGVSAADGTFTIGGLDARAYTVGFYDGSHRLHPLVHGSASTDPTTGTPVTPVGGTVDLGTVTLAASTAPDAPTDVSATPGDGQVTVTWSAPADDGGAPITGYTVTNSSGQSCATTGALNCVVSGLTNGQATRFKVTATNAVGTSGTGPPSPFVTPEPADFCTQDHSGVDFTGAHFTNADLVGCDFSGNSFKSATLNGADLTGADLSGANLTNARLADTDLTGTTLTGLISGGINGTPVGLPAPWRLINGGLIGPGAVVHGANLAGVDLSGTDLSNVDFSPALLVRTVGYVPVFYWGPSADLSGADLSGANLSGANLMGGESMEFTGLHPYTVAPVPGADLTGANLANVDLTGATLGGDGPVGVVLTDADLTGAILDGVISGGITGTPFALPAGWTLVDGNLIPPSTT